MIKGSALFLVVSLIALRLTAQAQSEPPEVVVIAAGVPRPMGETRDYDGWFAELADAGVTAFLATSQYQEVPEALALNYEADFVPPCSPDDPAFAAMRAHDIQLVVPGQLFYPPGELPPLEADPLRALLACTGDAGIFGVLSVDEPVNAPHEPADPTRDVRAIYERVQQVAPNLPVLMVHAPIPSEIPLEDGTVRPVNEAEIAAYLVQVEQFSAYADIIGFDVYPIPPDIASVIAPGQGVVRVPYAIALPAYLDWLHQTADGRPIFMTLQGFSYARLLDAETNQQAADAGYRLRFPTETELRDMACLTAASDAMIVWWGQSHLTSEDTAFWTSLLDVTRGVSSDPDGYCQDE